MKWIQSFFFPLGINMEDINAMIQVPRFAFENMGLMMKQLLNSIFDGEI
jgi:hypothetical protein